MEDQLKQIGERLRGLRDVLDIPVEEVAQTIGIDIKSELFKVLTQIQDEVHRYAITFHRDKRSKHALHSELDDIKGIGPKTKELLINKLKSVSQVKLADLQTLTEYVGNNKASIIYNYFHPSNTENDK